MGADQVLKSGEVHKQIAAHCKHAFSPLDLFELLVLRERPCHADERKIIEETLSIPPPHSLEQADRDRWQGAPSTAGNYGGLNGAAIEGANPSIAALVRDMHNFAFVGGFSYVFQDEGLAEIGRLDEDMAWTYVMINATF